MFYKLQKIEDLNGCIAYDCGKMLYISLEKGAIDSDHSHNYPETVFLMKGEVEIILGEKKESIAAPAKIIIPANTYHKFTAVTEVIGLEIKTNKFQRFISRFFK